MGSGAALLRLVLQLLSVALVLGMGRGQWGYQGLRLGSQVGGVHPCSDLSEGRSWGPRLPLPALPGGAWPASTPPWLGEQAWWGSWGLRHGVQEREGASCHGLGRNSCRRRWGRGCAGIRESEVNYLPFERGKTGGPLWELSLSLRVWLPPRGAGGNRESERGTEDSSSGSS